jgi:hypothetical protein
MFEIASEGRRPAEMNPSVSVFVCGLIAIAAGAAVAYWAKDKLGRPNIFWIDPVFFAVFFVVWLLGIIIASVIQVI